MEILHQTTEAVLCFVVHESQVLLIKKKRGFGKGKINGPGGKIEPGETPMQSAIRETIEEVGLHPIETQAMGKLDFYFTDGLHMRVWVFKALKYQGVLTESEEAAPFWCSIDAIPYDLMWEDDRHWLPLVLSGKAVEGVFHFEGERMLSMELKKKAVDN